MKTKRDTSKATLNLSSTGVLTLTSNEGKMIFTVPHDKFIFRGIDLNKFFGRIYNVTNEECLYLASTLTMRGSKWEPV